MNIKVFILAIIVVVLFKLPGVWGSFNTGQIERVAGNTVQLFEQGPETKSDLNQIDMNVLKARYEQLEPSPKPEPVEVQSAPVNQPKVAQVDKKLLPNFARFDNEHQISLVAIFSSDSAFALVELLNYKTRESQFKKVALNERLYSFELQEINEKSVLFAQNGNTIELKLFR